MNYRSRSQRFTKKKKLNLKGLLQVTLLLALIGFILFTYRTVNLVTVLGGKEGYFQSNIHGRENYLIAYEKEGLETAFIISVDKEHVYFIDIPINTRVDSHGQRIMLNELYDSLGVEGLTNGVEYIFSRNIKLDNYIIIKDEGLGRLVGKMKGLEINLEDNLNLGSTIIIEGKRTFDSSGTSLLFTFIDENDRSSYIQRQVMGLQSVFNQYFKWSRSLTLASGLSSMDDYFYTNMTVRELAWFRNMLDDVDYGESFVVTVPGRTETIVDRDFWIIDTERAANILQNITQNQPVILKEDVYVEVLNGNGVGGVAGRYSKTIENLGFINVTPDNADHQNYEQTIIRYPKRYQNFAEEIAEALGVVVDFVESNENKITVVIGKDLN